jgi:hypothetical protein
VTARIRIRQDRKKRTARRDRQNMTGNTGHAEQERQKGTGRTEQAKQDRQNQERIARVG